MRLINKMMQWIDAKTKIYPDFEFSHQNILQVTQTNCPYSVLRTLKKYYDWDEKIVLYKKDYILNGKKMTDTVSHKVYFNIRKKKDEN